MEKFRENLNKKMKTPSGWLIFLKNLHPIEIFILIILPSPSWPFYFMYKDDIKNKYIKINKKCKEKIRLRKPKIS